MDATNYLHTLLLTAGFVVLLVGLAVVLLAVKIIFKKGGRFPTGHIHDNPEWRRRGITCPRDEEFYNEE